MATRKTSRFSRGAPRYAAQPTTLVLCEDRVSSVAYLRDASAHFRSFATVEVSHCGKTDPKGIVMEALARSKNYDFVYCVIDRDTHETFDEAVRIAKESREKLRLIVSYPSYEFWLLIHFCHSRKPYVAAGKLSAGDVLVKDLCSKEGMEDYSKGKPTGLFDRLIERLPDARKRSEAILSSALEEGSLNPSTEIHDLISKFEDLGSLKAA